MLFMGVSRGGHWPCPLPQKYRDPVAPKIYEKCKIGRIQVQQENLKLRKFGFLSVLAALSARAAP